jgi:2-polyprenyl-3-methyl-5-hydroxy-6-metoxy-1,4-benzoquinol methylase
MEISERSSWKSEFDYQWENLDDFYLEYNEDRINELLKFSQIEASFFKGKKCLDAGCGVGRYTYALMKLGAEVKSFDASEKAITACKKINSDAYVLDINSLKPNPVYDFVLCWGVLHHLPNPREGFRKVVSQVKPGGIVHIMVYHKDTQKIYYPGRKIWRFLPDSLKFMYIKIMIAGFGGTVHGWWDALNPNYNYSFDESEVFDWFEEEGFRDITLTEKYNINMKGIKK